MRKLVNNKLIPQKGRVVKEKDERKTEIQKVKSLVVVRTESEFWSVRKRKSKEHRNSETGQGSSGSYDRTDMSQGPKRNYKGNGAQKENEPSTSRHYLEPEGALGPATSPRIVTSRNENGASTSRHYMNGEVIQGSATSPRIVTSRNENGPSTSRHYMNGEVIQGSAISPRNVTSRQEPVLRSTMGYPSVVNSFVVLSKNINLGHNAAGSVAEESKHATTGERDYLCTSGTVQKLTENQINMENALVAVSSEKDNLNCLLEAIKLTTSGAGIVEPCLTVALPAAQPVYGRGPFLPGASINLISHLTSGSVSMRLPKILETSGPNDMIESITHLSSSLPWVATLWVQSRLKNSAERTAKFLKSFKRSLLSERCKGQKTHQLMCVIELVLTKVYVHDLKPADWLKLLVPIFEIYLNLACKAAPIDELDLSFAGRSCNKLVNDTCQKLITFFDGDVAFIQEAIIRSTELMLPRNSRIAKPIVTYAVNLPTRKTAVDYFRAILLYFLLRKYESKQQLQDAVIERAENMLGAPHPNFVSLYGYTSKAKYQFKGRSTAKYLLGRENREALLQGYLTYHALVQEETDSKMDVDIICLSDEDIPAKAPPVEIVILDDNCDDPAPPRAKPEPACVALVPVKPVEAVDVHVNETVADVELPEIAPQRPIAVLPLAPAPAPPLAVLPTPRMPAIQLTTNTVERSCEGRSIPEQCVEVSSSVDLQPSQFAGVAVVPQLEEVAAADILPEPAVVAAVIIPPQPAVVAAAVIPPQPAVVAAAIIPPQPAVVAAAVIPPQPAVVAAAVIPPPPPEAVAAAVILPPPPEAIAAVVIPPQPETVRSRRGRKPGTKAKTASAPPQGRRTSRRSSALAASLAIAASARSSSSSPPPLPYMNRSVSPIFRPPSPVAGPSRSHEIPAQFVNTTRPADNNNLSLVLAPNVVEEEMIRHQRSSYKRFREEENDNQHARKRLYDPPLNQVSSACSDSTDLQSIWESNVVDSEDLTSTVADCNLLSVDLELGSLISLFTDPRDDLSPFTSISSKRGRLEQQFRTPKYAISFNYSNESYSSITSTGFTGMVSIHSDDLTRSPMTLPELIFPEITKPSRKPRAKNGVGRLAATVEKCKTRLSSIAVKKPQPEAIPPPKETPPPVKRGRGRPRKKKL